jgi:hypothetical protein
VAVDDQDATLENASITTRNVLANDVDPDGDPLVVASFTQPDRGAVEDNGDGTFFYTPSADWHGVDRFTYTAIDGRGGEGSATVSITVSPAGFDLFVAPGGDDDAAGTVDAPLATLEAAREALRAVREAEGGLPDGGAVVWVRGGVYERRSAFVLTAEDAGTAAAPVLFAGYPGEEVRIVGGARLDGGDFAAVTAESDPAIWARLDPAAQGAVVSIDLATAGIDDYGELTERGFGFWSGGPSALELFVDQAPMELARWPDATESSPFVAVASVAGERSFTYDGDRPARWTAATDVWFHGYWFYLWADRHVAAESIDTATRTVTLVSVPGYGIAAGQPFYALNLLEEITVPGEWYLDRSSGALYLWPPTDLAAAEIYASMTEAPLVELNDTAYVTFEDMTLEMSRGELVRITGGHDNAFVGCVLRNAGLEAAIVSGTNNGLDHCEIRWTGNGGVRLEGGDRRSLTRGYNYVRSCHIHDFSRWSWTYTPAVDVDGCGHSVSHNWIHDAPHTAVLFHGNEHFVEYNEIHDVCRWAADAGAIYSGRDWGFRGNRVQYNFIHDVDSQFEGYGTHGIYLDDCVSGVRVFGNVLYRISGNAIQHGGGRDDLMENNVIARCGVALAADSRGVTWIRNDGSDWDLLQKVIDMGYQDEPWSATYPELAAIPSTWDAVSAAGARWLYPEGSVFSRNVSFSNAEYMTSWGEGEVPTFDTYAAIADNLLDVDPLFVDEEALDLALSAESPALAIPGFVDIPFGDIGIEPVEDE